MSVVHLYSTLEQGMESVLPLSLIFFYQTLHTLSVQSMVHSGYVGVVIGSGRSACIPAPEARGITEFVAHMQKHV